jgi:hypothetical protein
MPVGEDSAGTGALTADSNSGHTYASPPRFSGFDFFSRLIEIAPHTPVSVPCGYGAAFCDAFRVFPDKRFLPMSRNNKNS